MRFSYSTFERRRDGFLVSNDRSRVDVDTVHRMLSGSYWAANIPREVVEASIAGSMTFGVYHEAGASGAEPPTARQVGFARVITDGATFAYLADVFIDEELRGRGLGRFLVECALAHPELEGLRRWMLVTRDAHALYAKCGFAPADAPANIMVRRRATAYGTVDERSRRP